jgi:simple sugar transport system ATP-binding protein
MFRPRENGPGRTGPLLVTPVVELHNVSLRYGAVEAVREASLAIAAGEAVGLCGDNGAGKSSLVRILAGVHPPSGGRMLIDGRELRFSGPRDALVAGIATIHQDLALVPRLPVWQNVFLGAEILRPSGVPGLRLLDKRRMREEARHLLGRLGISLPDVEIWVEALSGGQRQAVAIARALRWDARLLIMDEPTAALGVRETEEVLELVRVLKRQGVAVLLVSHDMKDVMAACDRVAIMRRGRIAVTRATDELDVDGLAHLVLTAA